MHRTTYQSRMTADEHEALEAFAKEYGRTWKSSLRECFAKSNYPGMSDEHASALQRLRNRRGPSFLSTYKLLAA